MRWVCLSVLAFLLIQSSEAATWPDAIAQGNQQLDRGLYSQAIAQYELALAVSDSPARRGHALYGLAVAHGKLAEYSLAEQCYKEALGVFRAEGDSAGLALSLAGLGEIYRDEYYPDQALILERQNLTALEQIGRDKGAEAAAILNITGAILFGQRRYKEAERDMKEALDIFSRVSGPENLDVALMLNNLGAIALARGRMPEAETLVTRGLAIRKARLGPDHPLVAGAMLGVASVYMAQRRYGEAERACRDSIAMMSRFLPPDHPDLIKGRMQLAVIAHDGGHPAVALDILEEAAVRVGQDRSAITVEYVQLLTLYSRYLEAAGQKEKSRRIHNESQALLRELNRPSQTNSTVAIGELASGRSLNP
jgi:tetratricopeptide (TPR) repeat protein